jgi:hypothetical protein
MTHFLAFLMDNPQTFQEEYYDSLFVNCAVGLPLTFVARLWNRNFAASGLAPEPARPDSISYVAASVMIALNTLRW